MRKNDTFNPAFAFFVIFVTSFSATLFLTGRVLSKKQRSTEAQCSQKIQE
jgi:hypothetical protein